VHRLELELMNVQQTQQVSQSLFVRKHITHKITHTTDVEIKCHKNKFDRKIS
jgi:hypothetical protein